MTPDAFRASLQGVAPPPVSAPLQALWWAAKRDWGTAHSLAQDHPGPQGDRVHAYLHRVEGDLPNARYWYARAGCPMPDTDLTTEWTEMVTSMLVDEAERRPA